MKKIMYLLLVVTMFTQCGPPTGDVITKDNIVSMSEELTVDDGISQLQDSSLNVLATMRQGRSSFIELINVNPTKLDMTMRNLVVGESDFNKAIDDLFIYFQENQVTYDDLLWEIERREKAQDQWQSKKDSIDALIEAECMRLHDQAKGRADSLSQLASFKVIGIKPYEIDYRDKIQVTVEANHYSGKPIEAVDFRIKLIDKLGDEIVSLGMAVSDRWQGSKKWYFNYDQYDYDRREIYKTLSETRMSQIGSQEFEITKINVDGEIIENDINYSLGLYDETNMTPGYCVYMEDVHPLNVAKEALGDGPGNKGYPHIRRVSMSFASLIDMGGALRESFKNALSN